MIGHAVTLESHTTVDDVEIDSRSEFAQVSGGQEQLSGHSTVGVPNYAAFSRLAGSVAYLPKWAAYRVQYRSLFRSHRSRLFAATVIVAGLGFGIMYCMWLVGSSDHYPDGQDHWALTTLTSFR